MLPSQTETSQLIRSGNQLTGFYMMGTLVIKRLIWMFGAKHFLGKINNTHALIMATSDPTKMHLLF